MKRVEIFTDGACSGNPGPGGWGAILRYNGTTKELIGGEADTTNNRMELMAAISALNALKEPCEVDLYTDSNYVKDGIGGWIHGWKRNGWKTADKKPVKNAELWQALDAATQAPQGDLALGEGPCRPCRERARRRAGAPGHGAVQAAVAHCQTRYAAGAGQTDPEDAAVGFPRGKLGCSSADRWLRAARGSCSAELVDARLGLDVERRHLAVVDDHREPLVAKAHGGARHVAVEPRRLGESAVAVGQIEDLAFAAGEARPGAHHMDGR